MNKFYSFVAIFAVCVLSVSFCFFSTTLEGNKVISCKASASFFWNKERLDLLVTQDVHDGKGFLSLSGISYNGNDTESYLNKSISFSYRQNGENYYFKSEMIMNSPQMTMSLDEEKRWLPAFFFNTDSPLLLKIRPYGKNAWVFYSGIIPLFVCERN